MSTFATVVGLAAAVCTTGANLPQLKKAWTTGQTDDISMNTLWVLASGLALWVAYGVLRTDRRGTGASGWVTFALASCNSTQIANMSERS